MRRFFISFFIIAVLLLSAAFIAAPLLISSSINKSINGKYYSEKTSVNPFSFSASNVSVYDSSGNKLLYLKKLKVKINPLKIIFNALSGIESIVIDSPELYIKRSSAGKINILTLLKPSGRPPVKLDRFSSKIKLSGGKIHFIDKSLKQRIEVEIKDVAFDAVCAKNGVYELHFRAKESLPAANKWSADGKFSFKSPFIDLRGGSDNFNLAPWVEMLASSYGVKYVAGESSVSFIAKGSASNFYDLPELIFAEIVFKLDRGSVKIPMVPSAVTDLKAEVSANPGAVKIDSFSGTLMGAKFSSRGEIYNFKSPHLSVSFEFDNLSLNRIAKLPAVKERLNTEFELEGFLSGKFSAEGSIADPRLDCLLSLNNGFFNGTDILSGNISAAASKKHVEVKNSRLLFDSGSLSASGWILPETQKLLLNVKASGVPPRIVKDLSLGSGYCDFNILGTIKDPVVFGNARMDSVAVQKMNLGATSADFLYNKKTLFISDARLAKSSGYIGGDAVYDLSNGAIQMSVAANNYAIPEINSEIAGSVSGGLALMGSASSPVAVGNLMFDDLSMSGLKFNTLDVPLAADKDFVRFSAKGRSESGLSLAASGSALIAKKPGVNVDFELSGIDASKLAKIPKMADLPFVGSSSELVGCVEGGGDMGYFWDALLSSGKSSVFSRGFLSADAVPGIISYATINNLDIKPSKTSPFSVVSGGVKEGQFLLNGDLNAMNVSGYADFRDMFVSGIPVSWFYADATVSKSLVSLKSLTFSGDRGSLHVKGTANPASKDFKLHTAANNLDLNYILCSLNIAPICGVDVKSFLPMDKWHNFQAVAGFEGDISMVSGKPMVKGFFEIPDGVWMNEKLTFNSLFSLDPTQIAWKNFNLSIGSGVYSGYGSAGFSPDSPLNIKISASDAGLERLIAFSPFSNIPVSGRFSGNVDVAGTLRKPVLNGTLNIGECMIAGQKIKSVAATVSTVESTLYLNDFTITLDEGEFRGSGSIASDGTMDLTFATADIPCDAIDFLHKWIGKSNGYMDLIIRVSGKTSNPVVSASFKTGSINLLGHGLDSIQALFSLKGSVLDISECRISRASEVYSLNGSLDLKDLPALQSTMLGFGKNKTNEFNSVGISGVIKNGSLPFLMSLATLKESDSYSGEINGDFSISAKGHDSTAKIGFEVTGGMFSGMPIHKFIFNLEKKNTFLTDILVDMSIPGGSLNISGEMDGIGGDKVIMESKDFDLALISPFLHLPAKFSLAGKCNLSGAVVGELPYPDISCRYSIADAKLGEASIGVVKGGFKTEHGSLLKMLVSAEDANQRVRLSGMVPYSMDGGFFKITDAVMLRSDFSAKNFNILSLFLPIEKESSVALLGDCDITGMFPDIAISGKVVVKDGVVTPSYLKNPIKSINAEVLFKDQTISIKNVSGSMGPGSFTLGGTIDFEKMGLKSMDLSLKGKDLQITAKTLFSGIVDCDSAFVVNEEGKKLSGTTSVKNSILNFSPAMFTSKSGKVGTFRDAVPEFFRGTALDMSLAVQNDVWATFMGSQVQAQGNLAFSGVLDEPLIKGDILLSKGSIVIPIVSTPFKLYYGRLRFDGLGMIPNIVISGDARFGEYAANLAITGPANKPNIKIDSDLPLSATANASGVLNSNMIYSDKSRAVGMDLALAGAVNDIALNSMLEFSVMRPILNQLGRTFGLTDVSVEFRNGGAMSVRLAKSLDAKDRFLLTYEYATTPQGQLENLWGIEYRFSRGMLVRVSQGSLGDTYLWIQARRRF